MTNVLHLDALVDVAPAPDHEAVERAQTGKHEPEVSGVDLNQKLILTSGGASLGSGSKEWAQILARSNNP